jgi:hypothetical protein
MMSRFTRSFAIVAACFGFVVFVSAGARAANDDIGLELIPFSKRIAEHRYESPRDYEGTIKFYKDKFKGYKNIKWSREVSVPAVKYIHFETTSKSKWQGVNIYQLPDGRVRYYVLPRPEAPLAAPAAAGGPGAR